MKGTRHKCLSPAVHSWNQSFNKQPAQKLWVLRSPQAAPWISVFPSCRSRSPISGLRVRSPPLLPTLVLSSGHEAPITDAVGTGVRAMLGPGLIPMALLPPASLTLPSSMGCWVIHFIYHSEVDEDLPGASGSLLSRLIQAP